MKIDQEFVKLDGTRQIASRSQLVMDPAGREGTRVVPARQRADLRQLRTRVVSALQRAELRRARRLRARAARGEARWLLRRGLRPGPRPFRGPRGSARRAQGSESFRVSS